MPTPRPYYILLERSPDGRWSPQFGDYTRTVVDEEKHEYTRSALLLPRPRPTYQVLRVHSDSQQAIDDLVARMNTRATTQETSQ